MAKKRLGRGIDALLQGRDLGQLEELEKSPEAVLQVPIGKLSPNPQQPRKTFPGESLKELARSIEERGILQPILAEESGEGEYTIIAGERRFRAAQLAGLTIVPVLTGEFSDEEKLEIALIENLQRENINPIEEAQAYRELMERASLTQEEVAQRLGKSRPAIANTLRLLRLPKALQKRVVAGRLSAGHARAILALETEALMGEAATRIEDEALSVRQAEELCSAAAKLGRMPEHREFLVTGGHDRPATPTLDEAEERLEPSHRGQTKSVEMEEIEQRLIERLGTKVTLAGTNNRGRIDITYLSMDDLERIVEIIEGA